jgi:drug/metabolite transporter (DMT)-like permease
VFGAEMAAVAFGLASAVAWGSGDFCGGLATRRASVLSVLFVSTAIGIPAAFLLALALGETVPPLSAFGWAALGGLAGTMGITSLYRGIASGQTAVVAPISSVVAAALPVVWAGLTEGLPGPLRLSGFAVALIGIWLVTSSPDKHSARGGVGLGLLAGVGFGGYYILISQAGAEATFWPLVGSRGVILPLVLAVAFLRRQTVVPTPGLLPLIALGGLLDLGGNALFLLASQAGRLDIAAVLASLYPATTVVLARLVLGDRVGRWQLLGIVVTFTAVALISM